MNDHFRHTVLLASVALCALIATPALAQSDAASAGGDIVVTAQKRSENINKVPASISVIGGGALGAGGIASIEDLTRAVPGVSFTAGTGAGAGEGNSVLEFRGVSSQGAEATVGIYLDETSITNSNRNVGVTQPVALDIARVEVLRGPQGTLYGASSEGGTVRFLHNKPDLTRISGYVAGTGSFTAHGGANYETSGVINLPLVPDRLAIRLGALSGNDSGWIDRYDLSGNLAQKGTNSSNRQALRFAVLFEPSDKLTVQAQVNYQRYVSHDSPVFYMDSSGTAPYATTGGLFKQSKEVPDVTHDRTLTASVEVEYRLPGAEITSVTSVYNRAMHQITDATFYDSNIMATAYFPALASTGSYSQKIATIPSPQLAPVDFYTKTEELRVASPANSHSPLKWVGGVYVSSQIQNLIWSDPMPTLPGTFQSEYGYPLTNLNAALGAPANASSDYWTNLFDDHQHTRTLQIAGFGQVDYAPIPKLHLTAGLRYQYTRQSYTAWGSGFFYIGIPSFYSDTRDARNFTPKFSVSYDVNPRSSVYATVAEGFRIGGPTGPLPSGSGNVCQTDYDALHLSGVPSNFSQDKLWSYEAGTKLQTADRSLSVNAAGYYINWRNLQQSITLPTCGFIFASNVGDARSIGGELEVHYTVPFVKGLKLGAAGSITDATLTKVSVPFATVGQHVLNVPDVTANISADYRVPLPGAIKATLHADYNYTGQSHGSFTVTQSNYVNNAYGVVNANLELGLDHWTVTIFAKNLLDDHTIIQQPTVNSVVEGYTVTPRTVGAALRRDF